MLQKEHRLRRTKDFHHVLATKRGIREGGLLLKVAPSKESSARIGIVVSKKVSKKATKRNRIRRVLQEAFRQYISSIPQGVDIALVVLPGFKSENPQDIHRAIHSILKKASLIT